MEQQIWLEREAIQEGNVGDNSYWQLDQAVARKSILKISQIRLVEQRWHFEVGIEEDTSRFLSHCECILSKTTPPVDGVWAGRCKTVPIDYWLNDNTFIADRTWKPPRRLVDHKRLDLYFDDKHCSQWLDNVRKLCGVPADHSARWLFDLIAEEPTRNQVETICRARDRPSEEVRTLLRQVQAPLNARQQFALEQALKHRLLLIQGPPGTGKTKLCAALAYLLMRIGLLLVTASSNAAVDNVLARLESEYPDCMPNTVRSGRREKPGAAGQRRSVEVFAKKWYEPTSRRFAEHCREHMEDFLAHFVTLASLDLRVKKNVPYASVLNDESAQCPEAETLAAVIRVAARLYLVGDHK